MEDEIILESCVEVLDDHIILRLPDCDVKFSDVDLDDLFIYPENLITICDDDAISFWNDLIPHLIRVRERKRDLYYEMGF